MLTFPRAGSSVGARSCIASELVEPCSLQQSAPQWRRQRQNRSPLIHVEIGTTVPAIEMAVPHHRAACIYVVRPRRRGESRQHALADPSADAQVRSWHPLALRQSGRKLGVHLPCQTGRRRLQVEASRGNSLTAFSRSIARKSTSLKPICARLLTTSKLGPAGGKSVPNNTRAVVTSFSKSAPGLAAPATS